MPLLHSLTLISHLRLILTYSPAQRPISVPLLAPSAIPPSLHVVGNKNTTLNLHLTDLCDRLLHARCLGRGNNTTNAQFAALADNSDDSSSFLPFLLSFFFSCAHYSPCWIDTDRTGCMQKREITGLSQQALILRQTNDTIIVCTGTDGRIDTARGWSN